jgi:FeS assembly SUF system protein
MSDAHRAPAATASSGPGGVTEAQVIQALRTCYDPEVPVNIYELGLIYGITLDPGGQVGVRMTLTAPNCPAAQELPAQVEAAVAAVPGVTGAKVDVVFDPPWNTCMMSEAARLELGM